MFLKPSKGQLKFLAGLDQAKIRRREGCFLAEGRKVVAEALRSNREIVTVLVRSDKEALWKPLLPSLAGKEVFALTGAEWKRISQDRESEGIAAVVAAPPARSFRECLTADAGRLLLLYRVGNPLNLGAILRSAHWFDVNRVLISTGSVDWTHPKAVRASMGSLFHLDVFGDVDFAEALPEIAGHGPLIGTTVRGGVPPRPLPGPSALLLGSESHGLPDSLLAAAGERWCIPRLGDAESLSLPQAAAILLHEWTKGSPLAT